MDMHTKCADAYERHKNLKLAAADVGMPWQTLYVHLKRIGVPVTGDKSKYGSDTDRLAAKGERMFMRFVPEAQDQNRKKFQSKIDFFVNGVPVDVKTARLRSSNPRAKTRRWAFSIKKQEASAHFFVCFCMGDDEDAPEKTLLVPGEIVRMYTTISVNEDGKGKWSQYEVDPESLREFFRMIAATERTTP